MTRANWAILAAARDAGGRVTPAKLRTLLDGEPLEAQVSAFARRGYTLALSPRGSLELVDWPNRLFAEEVACNLETQCVGSGVETHWRATSTNDLARRHAARGRDGVVVFAEEQTAGRGRFGRTWAAPRYSSILFSTALSTELPPAGDEGLALAGAIAVAEALDELYHLPARIRWPNDVLVEGRKVSGVIVENLGVVAGARRLVLGCGVNVNTPDDDWPKELRGFAASVSTFAGKRCDRALIARAVLRRLDFWWETLNRHDDGRLMEAWRRLSDIIGAFVTVECRGRRSTGRVVDLDSRYGLVLQLSGGPTRAFPAAETSLIYH